MNFILQPRELEASLASESARCVSRNPTWTRGGALAGYRVLRTLPLQSRSRGWYHGVSRPSRPAGLSSGEVFYLQRKTSK